MFNSENLSLRSVFVVVLACLAALVAPGVAGAVTLPSGFQQTTVDDRPRVPDGRRGGSERSRVRCREERDREDVPESHGPDPGDRRGPAHPGAQLLRPRSDVGRRSTRTSRRSPTSTSTTRSTPRSAAPRRCTATSTARGTTATRRTSAWPRTASSAVASRASAWQPGDVPQRAGAGRGLVPAVPGAHAAAGSASAPTATSTSPAATARPRPSGTTARPARRPTRAVTRPARSAR